MRYCFITIDVLVEPISIYNCPKINQIRPAEIVKIHLQSFFIDRRSNERFGTRCRRDVNARSYPCHRITYCRWVISRTSIFSLSLSLESIFRNSKRQVVDKFFPFLKIIRGKSFLLRRRREGVKIDLINRIREERNNNWESVIRENIAILIAGMSGWVAPRYLRLSD